jgi:hypothetical protein
MSCPTERDPSSVSKRGKLQPEAFCGLTILM